MKKLILLAIGCCIVNFLPLFSGACWSQMPNGWKAHDLRRPLPPVVDPGDYRPSSAIPSDAKVLFDGTHADHWQHGNGDAVKWKLEDGYLEVKPGTGDIQTKESFGDCQLHIEWASPAVVKGSGQGRGNSGVFPMGKYEIQILDSYENATYADGSAASIYGQHPPLVNASRPPGQWQTYDIIFRQPVFDDQGNLKSPASITVLHNGVLVQDHAPPFGPTNWIKFDPYAPGPTAAPLRLQDHGDLVRFRNIWIRELKPAKEPLLAPVEEQLAELTTEQLEQWMGDYDGFSVKMVDQKPHLMFFGKPLEMIPLSENEFRFRMSAGSVTFTRDESGDVIGKLTLDAAGTRQSKRKN